MADLFSRKTVSRIADSLARYLPGDRLFAAKRIAGSALRRFLLGLSGELRRANGTLWDYQREILPDQTTKFLPEWERVVGIPDDCFSGTGTIDERRRDVLVKLAASGVQTADDFVTLAALFGVEITVQSGIDTVQFPITFPFLFIDNETEARFTIVITFKGVTTPFFPLQFPVVFGESVVGALICLFQKLKPANVNLVLLSEEIYDFYAQAGESLMQAGEPAALSGNRLIL